ncbi:MAG: patatin-like phospholipase family protein [Syntrophobacterales bacterium]|jgi:patatin-like phospholipase/acyl hydrolase
MSRLIKVLSIDGGGIRGIIPAMVLNVIERATGKPICQLFDLIAGTSTGGILALGLTKPNPRDPNQPHYPAEKLIDIYEQEGPTIFSRSVWHKLHSVWNLADEKYPSSGIEGVLKDYFEDALLSQALTELVVPSYEIEKRDCFFFKRSKARANPSANDFLMRQVARSTSAAPTYFEPCWIAGGEEKPYWALIDGGVFANNPAMCALAEAMVIYGRDNDFLVVSLGTGQLTRPLDYEEAKDWGLAGWAQNIINIIFDGVQDTVDYQLRQLLPVTDGPTRRYYRFQVELDRGNDDMDDASRTNLDALRKKADDLILLESAALGNLCMQLGQG